MANSVPATAGPSPTVSSDLGLEYLWNGDEYGSLENSLKTMEKNAEYGGQPEILALVHVIPRML